MKTDPWSTEIAKVAERRYLTSKNSDSSERGQRTEHCTYCGLSRAHPKGKNYPAYGVQCEICKKFNHFSSVWSPAERRNKTPMRHGQQKKERVKKAEETYSSIEMSSDDGILAVCRPYVSQDNDESGRLE